jgi:two-component system sensor histidine kinase DesK
MGECRSREAKAERYGGLVWTGIWLWPLLGPAVAVARGQADPVLPAALGLVAFVVLYMIVMSLAWQERVRSRRRLFGMLGVLAVLGLALAAGYAGQPDAWLVLLLFVGVAGASALRPPAHAFGWLAGMVAALVAIGAVRGVSSGEIGSTAFSAFMSGVLVFVVRRMNLLIDQLRTTRAELAEAAVSQERLRFSRDLHDLLGHTLSLITLKSELANRVFERDPHAARREIADVERIARDALTQVRRAVTGIRAAGFAAELASAKLLLESNSVRLNYEVADIAIPAEIETALAMTVREAVTNVQRHARATCARVKLCTENGRLVLHVEDDGRGGAIVPGNGLTGMRERLAGIGADLRVESERGRGTKLTASLPLPPEGAPAVPSAGARLQQV